MTDAAEPEPLDALEQAWRAYLNAELGRLNVTAEGLMRAAQRCGWRADLRAANFAPWSFEHLVAAGRVAAETNPWS